MKIRKIYVGFAFAFLALVPLLQISCVRSAEPEEESISALIERGNGIVKKLGSVLMTTLTTKIEEEGLVEAMQYCSVKATSITDSLSAAENVKITRISHQNRNPRNITNNEEFTLLKKYVKQLKDKETLEPVIISGQNGYTYYSPILISMPTCLQCHGKPGVDIKEDVTKAIKNRYPEDKATGFSMGEVRGMFKIEFKKEE